ncbi:MAG: PD-(D/E)XK nuclease family protein [Clostridia bacterium]|nr:PD-(D/E)XK nuclease family protein [Clostridia bacterium]
MLKVLTGRSGCGKSAYIFEEIAKCAADGESGILLLVPEQYAFNAERELCAKAGNGISLFAEVMSFRGLARRIFAETGGAPVTVEDGGRLLAMFEAHRQVKPLLRVYAGRSDPEMTSRLLSAVDEFKSYCVSPSDLSVAEDERGGLADKLHDLSLIYGAYDAIMSGDLGDPADTMSRLFDRLSQSGWLAGKRIYIDGFVGFTPAEIKIIGKMAESAESVTVTLCIDGDFNDPDDVFAHSRATLGQLKDSAGSSGFAVCRAGTGECRRFSEPSSDLAFLEKAVFDYGAKPKNTSADGSVRLMTASVEYSECELAASEIRRLVFENGYRFREIAVVMPEKGFSTAISVFEKYGIPAFADRTESVLSRTPVKAVCTAVEAASQGFDCETVIRLAKTGVAGIDLDEADDLETYASMWNVNGSRWYEEPGFTMHPGGYGEKHTEETESELMRLNTLRKKLALPLYRLKKGLESGNVREMTRAVCNYLEDIDFGGNVGKRRAELVKTGNLRIADEYSRLVGAVYSALEQFVLVMENERLSPKEYAPLLRVILSGSKVGTIPTTLDSVAVGESTRARFLHPRAVFVLGATEGVFPPSPVDSSLLTSADRRSLFEDRNIRLAPDDVEQVRQGQLTAYRILSAPSEKLFVSWPSCSSDGTAVSPSYICARIRALLPSVSVEAADEFNAEFRTWAPVPCAELGATVKSVSACGEIAYAAEKVALGSEAGRDLLRRAELANLAQRGPIADKTVISGLYHEKPRITVSRLELFNTCRFAFFARYGLGLEAPKKAELEPRIIGTFVHYVLEKTAGEISERGEDPWSTVTKEEAAMIADKYIEEYAREQLGGLEDKPSRIRWLFERLKSRVYAMTDSLCEEFSSGDFRPLCFEMEFKGRSYRAGDLEIPLSGQADRVDFWDCGDKRYIRIVDYKTGEKKFDYSDISAGLGIQLLLYLFVLTEDDDIPAGVLYVPSLKKMKTVRPGEEDDDKTGRTGILLGEENVISAMEKPSSGELRAKFIPVSYSSKDGSPKGKSLVTGEQFEFLREHVGKVLNDMYSALLSGEVECMPYADSAKTSCDRCDYRALCQFDTGRRGDKFRTLKKVKPEEFYGRGDSGK